MPMQAALYARVSTHDQQTLPLQIKAMRAYVKKRGWKVSREESETGSGAKTRPKREELLAAARRREVDVIVVWRLDRWGRSLRDLVTTLNELSEIGVAFVSLSDAIDLTTASGRAMAGMVAVFAEFERDLIVERINAGLAQAREQGRIGGRPTTDAKKVAEARRLYDDGKGLNKSAIARQLGIPRTTLIGLLAPKQKRKK